MIETGEIRVGDRVRFDGKSTSWLVRAESEDGRYQVATCAQFGKVHYTILDRAEGFRGLEIASVSVDTLRGPDRNIDKILEMLRLWTEGVSPFRWTILRISTRTPA